MTGLIWKVVLPFGLLIGAFTIAGSRLNDLGGLIDRVGGDVAQTQLDTVVKQIENEVASGGIKITTQSAFVSFVRNSMAGGGKGGDPSQDRWGGTLALHIVDADRFVVVSCGRDKQCQTRDDLIAWGTFSREGPKGGENVPGWPRDRVVEMPPEATDGAPATAGAMALVKSVASWLRARPWISGGLGGLWLLSFLLDRINAMKASRKKPPPAHLGARSAPVRARPSAATAIAMPEVPTGRVESLELEPMSGPAPMTPGPRTLAPAARPELDPLDVDASMLDGSPSAVPAPAMGPPPDPYGAMPVSPMMGPPSGQYAAMPVPPMMGPPSGPHRAMPAPPPIALADLPPLLGAEDDPVALPHAATLAAFASPVAPPPPAHVPQAYEPAPPRRLAPIAPIEPLGIEDMPPLPQLGELDPFADEPPPPIARPAPAPPPVYELPSLTDDLPSLATAPEPVTDDLPSLVTAPEPVRPAARRPPVEPAAHPVPESPSMSSGAYSISRGTSVVEGDGPSSMRDDMRVPAARPKPAPARPRKHSGEQPALVVERVRPGGIVTETQRIKAHHLRKEDKGE